MICIIYITSEKVQVEVSAQVLSVSVKMMIDSGALGVFQKAILC